MSSRPTTSPANYIFLKPRGKKSAKPKRVLMPISLAALKKNASKVLDDKRKIVSFTLENGRPITNIRDISYNATIYVVYEEDESFVKVPNSDEIPAVSLSLQEQPNPTTSTPKRTPTKSDNPTRQTPRNVVKITMGTPKHSETIEETTATPKTILKSTHKQPPPSTEAAIQKSPVPTLKKAESSDYSSEEYTDSGISEEEEIIENLPTEEEEVDETTPAEKIMGTVLETSSIRDDVINSFAAISPESQEFLTSALGIEEIHQYRYANKILEAFDQMKNDPADDPPIEELETLRAKARKIISKHRVIMPGGVCYNFKTAIVGPRGSGKSTFMKILLKELITDVIAADCWKSTFIFPVDIGKLMEDGNGKIFEHWVEYLFAQLRAQVPSMLEYLPAIEKCFAGITSSKGSMRLPKTLAQILEHKTLMTDIQSILSNMASLWFNSQALVPWWMNIAHLPLELAKAFGFQHTIFVYDHFDDIDVFIDSEYPFEESEKMVSLSEIWKMAISHTSCIFGARNSNQFMSLMDPVFGNTCNLSGVVHYHTMNEIVQQPKYADQEIVVVFEETNETMKLTVSACAGIPRFLVAWYELNKQFDIWSEIDEEDAQYQEQECFVIGAVEDAIKLLFISDETLTVKTARRRSISKM